jgi:hypothetical protein
MVINAKHPAEKSGKESVRAWTTSKKSKNKAGMLMIINDFCFWNRPKAGMCMKTGKLADKAGMLLMPSGLLKIESSSF